MAISYAKGAIVCHQYDKLDGAYFAKFVQDNFENMFRLANKMGHDCLYRTTVLFKIAR